MSKTNTDNKSTLINVFKSCLNILRDGEGLTGEKALRNMSYLLILKLIESHFGNKIDIDNYNYSFNHIQDHLAVDHKEKLLKVVRFSNILSENEDNLPNILKYLWNNILSVHPSTKNIFLKDKCFDIQNSKTFKTIINKINELDLSKTEYDILGNAYEEVIQDIMTGKVLGQFFTQPLIKKIMIKLIDPKIYPDGKIETCCDPTMGTGGFLITYLQYILNKSKESNIELDWDFIRTEGLYGKELEPDTYQLAVSNMLISSGYMFEQLERGDSIREPILKKYDNVLANPPFGIKGLKYDDFNNIYKSEYLPIKTDNAVSLFIQLIIYMLKINGKCAIVLPDGQDLFSKTNNTLIAVREYLLKTCDLKEIIYLPSGIFTYTNIKTCIFYFIKKKEGSDILEIKMSKNETFRKYKFSNIHQTTKINFYTFDFDKDIKNLLIEVPIEQIINNSYSLNYSEYMKDEEEQYGDDIIIKTIGEVCEIQNGKRIIKDQVEHGKYPVLGGGGFTSFYTNEYSREGKTCKISREGMSLHNCVMILNEQYYLNSQAFTIESKNENLINNYLFYYLYNNKNEIFNCGRGSAQKAIDINMFKSIKIPIPSIEKQKEIIEYLDFLYEKSNKENILIKTFMKANEYYINNQKKFGENIIKNLGDCCEIQQGNLLGKTEMIHGIYNVIGGGKIIGKHNQKNRDGNNFILTRVGNININYINEPYYLTDNGFSLNTKHESVITKYIYYLLLYNKNYIINLYQGVAQKVISKSNLKLIKLPIPSIERQQEIIKYCESKDILIKQLENDIIQNKKEAKLFILNIVKSIDQNDLLVNESINSSEEEL